MIVTKKALSRRTFLRGAGAAVALPLLDAMIPALTAQGQTPAAPQRLRRLGYVYIPMGRDVSHRSLRRMMCARERSMIVWAGNCASRRRRLRTGFHMRGRRRMDTGMCRMRGGPDGSRCSSPSGRDRQPGWRDRVAVTQPEAALRHVLSGSPDFGSASSIRATS